MRRLKLAAWICAIQTPSDRLMEKSRAEQHTSIICTDVKCSRCPGSAMVSNWPSLNRFKLSCTSFSVDRPLTCRHAHDSGNLGHGKHGHGKWLMEPSLEPWFWESWLLKPVLCLWESWLIYWNCGYGYGNRGDWNRAIVFTHMRADFFLLLLFFIIIIIIKIKKKFFFFFLGGGG